eukprot:5317805-Amphidinium_carterae.1
MVPAGCVRSCCLLPVAVDGGILTFRQCSSARFKVCHCGPRDPLLRRHTAQQNSRRVVGGRMQYSAVQRCWPRSQQRRARQKPQAASRNNVCTALGTETFLESLGGLPGLT